MTSPPLPTTAQTQARLDELSSVLDELWRRMQFLPPGSREYRQLAEYHARQMAELEQMSRDNAALSRILNPEPRGFVDSAKRIFKLLGVTLVFCAVYVTVRVYFKI